MSISKYLKRIFQAYYQEYESDLPIIDLLEHREFGFLHWDIPGMIRPIVFEMGNSLKKYLINNGPKHVFSSGTLYLQPDHPDMSMKGYQGCDFIIDIDVDHFDTPCKGDHDYWICKKCGKNGSGMVDKCPKCGKLRLKKLSWICGDCLEIAKNEIKKLMYDFLIPDFGVKKNEMKIAFSGHRGYHLIIANKRMRLLSSEDRRNIADFLSGKNLSFELLGLREVGSNIFGLMKQNIGWSQKIVSKIEEILINYSNVDIENLLLKFSLNRNLIQSFLNTKEDFLQTISDNTQNMWNIEGFGLITWRKFLTGISKEIGAEIDEPVTIDIHRLIRYPGTLHGKTGFKVQELDLKILDDFTPLNENNEKIDPIVFYSKNMLKLRITEPMIPPTHIKNETYGPYKQDEIIEVPNHIAVFLLCKEVAKMI